MSIKRPGRMRVNEQGQPEEPRDRLPASGIRLSASRRMFARIQIPVQLRSRSRRRVRR